MPPTPPRWPAWSVLAGTGRSHAPDMATFLVTDALAVGVSHLAINLMLGLVGGRLGALIALGLGSCPRTDRVGQALRADLSR